MNPGKLDDLRKKLLFNKVVDVWEALCSEKDWQFNDFQTFSNFIQHLRDEDVVIQKLPICANEEGDREDLSKRSSIFFGDPLKTFVVKTDSKNIEKIRTFRSN
tara:strand:- start:251 stop:559 length:309 start_codon:yes stop_codon:yes gene_type:complete